MAALLTSLTALRHAAPTCDTVCEPDGEGETEAAEEAAADAKQNTKFHCNLLS